MKRRVLIITRATAPECFARLKKSLRYYETRYGSLLSLEQGHLDHSWYAEFME